MDATFYIHGQVAILNYSAARRCYRWLNHVPARGIRIIVGGLPYHFFNPTLQRLAGEGLAEVSAPWERPQETHIDGQSRLRLWQLLNQPNV